jgi:serine/threonine-protein kinase RsbW
MPTQTFPGEYESLEKIAHFIREESESIGLTHAEVFAVETAVDEAVSNIIEHAYLGENKGTITCTCLPATDHITIILEDFGQPFDPRTVPPPELDVPLKQRKINGLGMFMMQKWMDEVHFEFCHECNRLVMVKYKEKKT